MSIELWTIMTDLLCFVCFQVIVTLGLVQLNFTGGRFVTMYMAITVFAIFKIFLRM